MSFLSWERLGARPPDPRPPEKPRIRSRRPDQSEGFSILTYLNTLRVQKTPGRSSNELGELGWKHLASKEPKQSPEDQQAAGHWGGGHGPSLAGMDLAFTWMEHAPASIQGFWESHPKLLDTEGYAGSPILTQQASLIGFVLVNLDGRGRAFEAHGAQPMVEVLALKQLAGTSPRGGRGGCAEPDWGVTRWLGLLATPGEVVPREKCRSLWSNCTATGSQKLRIIEVACR